MNVAIVLFDGFDELDALGPYEVFETAAAMGADVAASLVTIDAHDVVRANHGATLVPDGRLGDRVPDLVLVPGGGWTDRDDPGVWAEYQDGAVSERIAALHEAGVTVASVCTGAMLLAAGGLLDGRPAATHHSAMADLRETDATVSEDRVVDDGDVLTAGGVTSGIDLALHLLRREVGEEVAVSVAEELAYEPTI